jgi:hypothetical protein
MRLVFADSAFAIYSTHSHRRMTATIYQQTGEVHGHEFPEPCYRIIVPLRAPVPVRQFAAVWTQAVNALHEFECPRTPSKGIQIASSTLRQGCG